jgi:hypothetical protein
MYAYLCNFIGEIKESNECDRIDIILKKYTVSVTEQGLSIFRNPRESKKHPGKQLGRKQKVEIRFNPILNVDK